jgi:hypothetical protein
MINELLSKLDGYNTSTIALFASIDAIGRDFYEEHKSTIDEAERLRTIACQKENEWAANPDNLPDPIDLAAARNAPISPGSFHGEEDEYGIVNRVFFHEPEERKQANELLEPLKGKLESHITSLGYKYFDDGITRKILLNLSRCCQFVFLPPDIISEGEGYDTYCQLAGEILVAELGTTDFKGTGWGAGADPIGLHLQGTWKYINIGSTELIHGKIPSIDFDVNYDGLPDQIPKESDDVALIKTLGGINTDTYHKFWVKADSSLRKGGIIVSSYDLPEEFSDRYESITNLAGTGRDLLKFEERSQRVPREMSPFYTGNELKFYRKIT